jgi:uncharacterized BrkB/YihY/UPF0761 family membrane protein
MKKNTLLLVVSTVILLLVGWLFFQLLNQQGAPIFPSNTGFREWFWEMRSLDLVVQVLLVFAGALGIAAILPVEDEDD